MAGEREVTEVLEAENERLKAAVRNSLNYEEELRKWFKKQKELIERQRAELQEAKDTISSLESKIEFMKTVEMESLEYEEGLRQRLGEAIMRLENPPTINTVSNEEIRRQRVALQEDYKKILSLEAEIEQFHKCHSVRLKRQREEMERQRVALQEAYEKIRFMEAQIEDLKTSELDSLAHEEALVQRVSPPSVERVALLAAGDEIRILKSTIEDMKLTASAMTRALMHALGAVEGR